MNPRSPVIVIAILALGGCAASEEPDAGAGGTAPSPAEGENEGGAPVIVQDGGGAPAPEEWDGKVKWPETLSCPENPQRVLIYDFRSGWWDDIEVSVPARSISSLLARACPNVTVEYHHILDTFDLVRCEVTATTHNCNSKSADVSESVLKTLFAPSFEDYTQLWVLSGDDGDGGIQQSEELFAKFLQFTAGTCLPVLIAAGDGNTAHANAVSKGLHLGAPFVSTHDYPGSDIPMNLVVVESRVTPSGDHPLFDDVNGGGVADAVFDEEWATTLTGDRITTSPHWTSIATDTQGNATLAAGTIAGADGIERPFVLDAGVQRYYAAVDDEPTETFAHNMIKLLGTVGCKYEAAKPK